MHLKISLCAMLLLAMVGCSKTDNGADGAAAKQPESSESMAGASDQENAPGTTTNFQEETPPPSNQ